MKVKVIAAKGFAHGKKVHPEGAELDIEAGAKLEAGLRFKQLEPVKVPKAKDEQAADPKGRK